MSSMYRAKVSVLIPTFNNANQIRQLLENVKWADEIVIIDSFSTDGTVEICRKYTERILQHEYINSARQKNWAIPQCSHEWVLQIDTDERLEPGLKEDILRAISATPKGIDGYRIPFKMTSLRKWVRVAGLYPQYHVRLFRKAVGRFEDKEVHAHIRVPGKISTLHHHIIHYGMPYITNQLRNIDRYSRYQADELRKRRKRIKWYHLLGRPIAVFLYYYFWKRGFLAGYRGLIISAINATFDFYAHAKLWEMEELELTASPK